MKINNIQLNNFGSYVGINNFDFNITKEKNIVLIGGQNGTGKTSLFTAIKLALYGPLCFNCQSANAQYFSKVKRYINYDAFTEKSVKAFVAISITVPFEREENQYTIKRIWIHDDGKLREELEVYQNNETLNIVKRDFLFNYLYSILPPTLFDFFFFDGEEIANFFATTRQNQYIKKAFYTLCGYDVFDVIQNFSRNYINKNEDDEAAQSLANELEEKNQRYDAARDERFEAEQLLETINLQLMDNENLQNSLMEDFKRAGGLTEEEDFLLSQRLKELERQKTEYSNQIRDFVTEKMPLCMAQGFTKQIREQIQADENTQEISRFISTINSSPITSTIEHLMELHGVTSVKTEELIEELTVAVSGIFPKREQVKYDLSKVQTREVLNLLGVIEAFNVKDILEIMTKREELLEETRKITQRQRESLDAQGIEAYTTKLTVLLENKNVLENNRKEQEGKIASLDNELTFLSSEHERLIDLLKVTAKYQNIYRLTQDVQILMNDLLHDLSREKLKDIEKKLLFIIRKIMRKDNFIDLIEIDDDFNIFLYKKQSFTISELRNLLAHLGTESLIKMIGQTGTEQLKQALKVENLRSIKRELQNYKDQVSIFDEDGISLYKRIEFEQLSKGEKQIFIISLYWSIIKVSGRELPFIIDTPYARIDTDHREQISREFFTSVSEQVLILSTDEEITKDYYEILKPYIAKEYLLRYDEDAGKSIVSEGYFY